MRRSKLLVISLIFIMLSLLLAIPIVHGEQNLTCATITEMAEFYMNGGATWDSILDGDICFVFKAGSDREMALYIFDVDSGQTEDGDMYIKPDYTSSGRSYTGTGRWVKMSVNVNDLLADDDIELDDKLVFEGATDDAYETTFSVTDPTADRTITVPNSDQTIGTATSIQDDLIVKADFADEDWGDVSVSSNSVTLDDDVIDPNHMADADHGDFAYSDGTASLDNDVVNTDEMADGDYGDFSFSGGAASLDADVVAPTEMANADHGDFSYSSGIATLDNDVVGTAEMADEDHGDFTYSEGSASLDNDVVGTDEIANGDYGDFTFTDGSAALDEDVIAPSEMADADHGDFTYSGGVATLDTLNNNLTIKNTDPSIIFDVDPNAGDTNFWIGVQADAEDDDDDKIQIGKGTTEGTNPFVTVDTSGNVGIRTTSPAYCFHILGTASANLMIDGGGVGDSNLRFGNDGTTRWVMGNDESETAFKLSNNTYADAEFTIKSNNIGIGITNPSSILDIQKSGTAKSNLDILELTNSINAADMDGTETSIIFNQWYYDANTPAVADEARITAGTEQDWTSTASTQDGYLAFKTALDGTVTEWMRIESSGEVGIGTTSPEANLEVQDYYSTAYGSISWTTSPIDAAEQIFIDNSGTSPTYAGMIFRNRPDAGYYSIGRIGLTHEENNKGDFVFVQRNGQSTYRETLRIKSSGNVGIGTTSPINTLDIEGGINQRDYFWEDEFDYEASGVEFESGLTADFWVTAGTNYASANVTFTVGPGGTMQAVTAGSDDDSVHTTGVSNFRVNSNPILEARFKVADITNVYIVAGFVEGSYDDKGTHDDDIFVIGLDSDDGHGYGADQIVAISNDNNGGVTSMDTNTPMVNNTYIIIKIDLTDTEQPRVWIDNTEIAAARITGTVQAGISISPYFMVQSLSGAADTANIDYIKCWQDRS